MSKPLFAVVTLSDQSLDCHYPLADGKESQAGPLMYRLCNRNLGRWPSYGDYSHVALWGVSC